MVYMFNVLKNKSTTIGFMHLWRYNDEDLSEIVHIDKKYKDYTSVKIDAFLLNQSEE